MSNELVKTEKKYNLVKTTNSSYVTDAEETVIESRLRSAFGDIVPYVGSSFGITVATVGIMASAGIVTSSFFMPVTFLVYLSLLLVLGGTTANYRLQRLVMQSLGVSGEWIKDNIPELRKARTFKAYYGIPTREQNFQLNCFPTELTNTDVAAKANTVSFVKDDNSAFLPTFIVTNTLNISNKGIVVKQVLEPTPMSLWDKTAQEIIDIQGIHPTQVPSLIEEYIPDRDARKAREFDEKTRQIEAQKRRTIELEHKRQIEAQHKRQMELEQTIHYERVMRDYEKAKAVEADIERRAEEARIRQQEQEAVLRVTSNLSVEEQSYISDWERDRIAYAKALSERDHRADYLILDEEWGDWEDE